MQTGKLAPAALEAPKTVKIFTTRIDTIYGANAIVLAPTHPVVYGYKDTFTPKVVAKIEEMVAESLKPRERDEEVEKDGIDTGLQAINPFSNEPVPVWVGNYVMMEYGTGAVMSVPAHDERDWEFAKKFGLPIRQVISEPHLAHEHHSMQALALEAAHTEYGVLVHSDFWNGKTSEQAKQEMSRYAETHGFGKAATTYRLRDWGISRQRLWGSPIPIIYCDDCGVVPEKYENLPVQLPDNAPITGTGESPLAKVPEFVETKCPNCEGAARRETDTMDTFVDSSWYYYRYLDPNNVEMPFDPAAAEYWTPVDQYIGGDDHAVMHLIYARFWTKVMRDLGLVKFDEPFKRLLTQGMVVGETFFDDSTGKRKYFSPDQVTVERDAKGKITSAKAADGTELKYAIERMSKSKGNGVDPDEMVEIYGADATRLFVLFAAPVENELVWHESGIEGAVRFLQRVWRFVHKWKASGQWPVADGGEGSQSETAKKLRQKTHQTIKRVQDSLETLQFNTPVAGLMELINALYEVKIEPETATEDEKFAVFEGVRALVLMLAPFAPHISEELYEQITGEPGGMLASGAMFPEFKPELAAADEIEIAIQVNGKLRSRIMASPEASNEELEKQALADEKVQEFTNGKQVAKVIVVPKRLVNVVVK
jgi:leucyl-tRNA synthetase